MARRLHTRGSWRDYSDRYAAGLMLTSGRGVFSRVIQVCSGFSPINHVGVVARNPSNREWYVMESTTRGYDFGEQGSGVRMNKLQDVVDVRHKVWVRPLLVGAKTPEEVWTITEECFKAWDHKPYEKKLLALAGSAFDWIPKVGDDASVFCSELAAMWLASLGMIDLDYAPAESFTPADFGYKKSVSGEFYVPWNRPQVPFLLKCEKSSV